MYEISIYEILKNHIYGMEMVKVRVGKRRNLSWKEFERDVSMCSRKVCIHQQITNLHVEIGAVI